MLVLGAFQALEITGFLALIGLGAFLSRGTMTDLQNANPLAFRAAVGLAIGAVAGSVVVILRTDLVPDSVEATYWPLLVAAVGILALLVVIRNIGS